MPEYDPFEEEEFTTQFNGRVVARMLAQVRPYWTWVVGFMLLIALCSVGDSFFTYLSKRIVDEGIVAGDPSQVGSLVDHLWRYRRGPGADRVWLYLPGRRAGRARPL